MLRRDEYRTLGSMLISNGIFGIAYWIAMQFGLFVVMNDLLFRSPDLNQLPVQMATSEMGLIVVYLFFYSGGIVFTLIIGGIFTKYGRENALKKMETAGSLITWSTLFPLIMSFGFSLFMGFLLELTPASMALFLSFISIGGCVLALVGWIQIFLLFSIRRGESGGPFTYAGSIVLVVSHALVIVDGVLYFVPLSSVTAISSAVGCFLIAAGLFKAGAAAPATYAPQAGRAFPPTPQYSPATGMPSTPGRSPASQPGYVQSAAPKPLYQRPSHCLNCGDPLPLDGDITFCPNCGQKI